ncbi:MAG: DUF4465 domain-containing protein [Mariniphaga sp.]|nr:DUF4465 domain-containing protein [Mariniphaga sp.]
MKNFYLMAGLWAALFSANAQNVATFENVELQTTSFYNGSDGAGGFYSGGFRFPNDYNADWGSWSGFSVSNMKDSVTAGWQNQYSAITAGGVNNSENYAVVFVSGGLYMELENPAEISGVFVTNSTYTYLSMRDGDDFSKKFGGIDGTDPDYFKLIVSGIDIRGNETAQVEFFLADFRFENSEEDYIVNTWEWFDLKTLGVVTALNFNLESTDIGAWGMNTPAYFCLDDFNGTDPESPSLLAEGGMEDLNLDEESFYNGSDGKGFFTSGGFNFKNSYNADWGAWSGFAASSVTDNQTPGWGNQYSAIPGKGVLESAAYAVSYVSGYSEIEFEPATVSGLYIANSTYSYWSMKYGDDFSKKFGGETGNEPDWFKVTIAGISENGDTTGTLDYYLADYRFENNQENYILDSWEWIDLASLGHISALRFSLSSSDVGAWGMNTPAYFCVDKINHQDLPPVIKEPVPTITNEFTSNEVFYVDLDSVFTDPDNPDSEIQIKLEYIDNSDLLTGSVVKGGKQDEPEITMLALNVTPGMTGQAVIIISGTSNGKKVWHSFNVIFSVPVFIPVPEKWDEVNIYPNPVADVLTITNIPQSAEKIVIIDSRGVQVIQQNLNRHEQFTFYDLRSFPSGIYILRITAGSEIISRKVLKK